MKRRLKNEIEVVYQKMKENYEEEIELLQTSSAFQLLRSSLEAWKDHLHQKSWTAKLWLSCVDDVNVLKQYIRAEHSCNWDLHFYALRTDVKSIYNNGSFELCKVCSTSKFEGYIPLEYFKENGYHAVWRSDRYWVGLWKDLIIEKVMIHSLKTRGGITRGGGMTDSVMLVWVRSMHICAAIHETMTTLTKMKLNISEQHVKLTSSSQQLDMKLIGKIILWFGTHNFFNSAMEALLSIPTGFTASDDDNINFNDAENVGVYM